MQSLQQQKRSTLFNDDTFTCQKLIFHILLNLALGRKIGHKNYFVLNPQAEIRHQFYQNLALWSL